MAYVVKNKSGTHTAVVYTRPGDPTSRVQITDRLESVVRSTAAEMESQIRRGEFIDPRHARITVGELWESAKGARHLEKASRKRDASHYRCHVAPKWANVQIGRILKSHVKTWVVDMTKAGVGPATIEGAVGVLRGILAHAVDDGRLRTNPAQKVPMPPRDAHVDRVLDNDEETALLENFDLLFPGRVDARLFVELLLDTGMRWEEAAALPPELVDTKRHRIHIAWVLERDGTARPYAKSEAGNRAVTYSDALAARLAAAKLAAPVVPGVFVPRKSERVPERLVFVSVQNKVLSYTRWRSRVWLRGLLREEPAMPAQREPGRPGPLPKAVIRVPVMDDPQPTAHDLRHTYGSRLADQGVPIHDIMKLMGHANVRSVQRYLHSSEDRFERARKALDRARGRIDDTRSA